MGPRFSGQHGFSRRAFPNIYWLVLTGTWLDYDFPYWECHHPNWLSLTPSYFQRGRYTTMENHHAINWKTHYKWAIFNSYVSLPEGRLKPPTSYGAWIYLNPAEKVVLRGVVPQTFGSWKPVGGMCIHENKWLLTVWHNRLVYHICMMYIYIYIYIYVYIYIYIYVYINYLYL